MVTRNQTAAGQRKAPQSDVVDKAATRTTSPVTPEPKPARAAKKSALTAAPIVVATPTKGAGELPVTAAGVKTPKAKKAKLVRDSFTIPKPEYLVLDELKQRAMKLSRPAKKGELIRAGVKALAAMSDAAFLTALTAVPTIKTGRPAKALAA